MARRILYVSRTWAMGGAQTILLSLLRSLPRDQFEIVVAPYASGSKADAEFAEAARAAGARLASPIPWSGMKCWSGASDALARLVADEGIELIHSHDNLSNTIVGLNRSRLNRPAIATAFGWWELNLKLKLLYQIERQLILPRFDAVYTVSHDMARKITRAGVREERVVVIHTGINVDAWAPRGQRAAVRAALGIPENALALGAVGRVSPEKGHDYLLRAMVRLRDRYPTVYAVLGGKGPDMERLRALAAELGLLDRLILPGYVADAAEFLEALDIFVMPSILEEGFPTSAMEGQAAGLPAVASDIGGTRETLIAGETGFLCHAADVGALAHALEPLLADADLRQRMGRAARNHIAEHHTLQQMITQFCSLYHRFA